MSTLSRTAFATILTGAALALALTGCSAPGASSPAAATQTKAAACKSLETSVSASTTELASSFGEISTNPDKAITGLQSVADAFDAGLKKVSNADVKKAGTAADDSIKEMIVEVKAVIGNPSADTTKLKAAVTNVQTEFTAIGKVCS
ncbi:hypothetical protein ACVXZ4_18140 [Lacisediminihabitans sp. FW035]